jgi:hypothetical protein
MTASSRVFILEEDDNEYFYVSYNPGGSNPKVSSWIETHNSYSELTEGARERSYIYSANADAGCMYVDKTPHIIGGTKDWVIRIMIGNGFNSSICNRLSYGVPFTAVCDFFKLKEGKHPDMNVNITTGVNGITYSVESAWIRCDMKLCGCLYEPHESESKQIYVYNENTVGIYNDGDEESLVLFQRVKG